MKLYWLGPKMGKTYASQPGKGIWDIDEFLIPHLPLLAESCDMSLEDFISSKHPKYINLLNEMINAAKLRPNICMLVTSNPVFLHPDYQDHFELFIMPHLDPFLERCALDKEDMQKMFNDYHNLLETHNLGKRCVFKSKTVTQLIEENFLKFK